MILERRNRLIRTVKIVPRVYSVVPMKVVQVSVETVPARWQRIIDAPEGNKVSGIVERLDQNRGARGTCEHRP
jgi:hypothetical protein